MEPDTDVMVARLVVRKEGMLVCAYLAQPDSMEGAILVGSIVRTANDLRRKTWMELMRATFCDLIQDSHGARPELRAPRMPSPCMPSPSPYTAADERHDLAVADANDPDPRGRNI